MFNVWTQTDRESEREREREGNERSLIIGALDSEVDTWTMEFHILNRNSTKTNPTFTTKFVMQSSLLGQVS